MAEESAFAVDLLLAKTVQALQSGVFGLGIIHFVSGIVLLPFQIVNVVLQISGLYFVVGNIVTVVICPPVVIGVL